MPKFAHIADVHYRSLSRHDEYKEVFEAFAIDCERNGVDHIVVCGDIFHTKTTGLSPEYIDALTWWMKRLSSVATLHLTLGNHDGNLTNLNRQDAVTPIYDAIKSSSDLKNKIYLYKQSGVYPIDETHNLCVFSLFDEEGWNNVKPEHGKYNIAVYHGSVDAALTETDWVLKSHITVDTFKDFDLVFLGDIHRTQFLAHRKVKGKDVPWIGYPGSTIQQNYAEHVDHGYFLWDVKGKDHSVSFFKLPNPKPYVTIEWSPDLSGVNLPRSARVRVRHKRPLTQLEIKTTIKVLQNNFFASEVTFNLDSKAHVKELVERLPGIKENFHNVDSLLTLLKKYDPSRDFSDDDWDTIKTLLENYLKESQASSVARNVKWSLHELRWDNLLGYGSKNKINFDNLEGIVGVFGPNRVGKSSIIGALMYCLFNGSDRGSLKNLEMINVRKDHAYARAVLDINGVYHAIERQTVKNTNKKEVTASTAVNIFKMDGDDAIELNGEQRSDTDKIIKSLIGSPEDFMLMSLSTQGDIDRFIREGSSHRKQVLTRFLDLDFFDRLYDLAKVDVTSLKAEVKSLQSMRNFDVATLHVSRLTTQSTLDKLTQEKDSLSEKIRKLTSSSKLSSLRDVEVLHKQKLIELTTLKDKVKNLETIFKTNSQSLESQEESYSSKFNALKVYDIPSLKERYNKLKDLKKSMVAAQHAVEKLELEIKRKRKSISVLTEVPCGDSFPTCKFIKDAHIDKGEFQDSLTHLNDALAELSKISETVKDIESTDLEDSILKASELKNEVTELELSLHKLRLTTSDSEDKLKFTLDLMRKVELDFQEVDNKLSKARSTVKSNSLDELELFRAQLKSLDNEIASLHVKLGSIDEQTKRAEDIIKTLDLTLKNLSRVEFVASAFSKKGIPSKILAEQLPVINSEIANVLAGIVNFGVELECTDSNTLDIYINYGDSRRIMELCSGMEKMISSIAIRVALSNVSTMPKSDIFIIDEGFGALDDANVDACKRMLISLKKYFKSILIISHVPAIKDVADIILEVQRVENDSKVHYG